MRAGLNNEAFHILRCFAIIIKRLQIILYIVYTYVYMRSVKLVIISFFIIQSNYKTFYQEHELLSTFLPN